MRRLFIILGFVLLGVAAQAQIVKPVKWSFNTVKKSAGIYEVHMTARIDNGWKVYSGSTPEGGPEPTMVSFKKNPLVLRGGKVKEVGKLIEVKNK